LTLRRLVAYPVSQMDLLVDADGHVLEPPDVWERYVDPSWRPCAIRVRRDESGRDTLEIDGRPARLTTPEMLGGLGGMGRSLEELAAATLSGRYAEHAPPAATDPGARLALLDREGLSHAVLYPTLGLQWEAEAPDAAYALAHARAYNRWIEEFCAGSGGRLVPVAHLSLGDPAAAADELRRAVRAGARGAFVLPFTWSGLPHGHPHHDPVWAAAQDLDVPVAIHTGIDPPARDLHRRFDGLTWPEAVPQHIWYLQLLFPQAVQQAFSTFFQFATFDRFPRLRIVVLESGAAWLGFWLDRMDALAAGPLRVTLGLRRRPSEYARHQCWIAADPDERALAPIIELVGADRFLWASDFPHADHGGDYLSELRQLTATLSPEARRAILGENAARLYRLESRAALSAGSRSPTPSPTPARSAPR
jgi:predicted TIM-barrel fold metal-dependent hydrolase